MINMDRLVLVRKVQQIGGCSITIVIPPEFKKELGIDKGDYIKIYVTGKQLVMEKVNIPK